MLAELKRTAGTVREQVTAQPTVPFACERLGRGSQRNQVYEWEFEEGGGGSEIDYTKPMAEAHIPLQSP
jgi:hypothetical protein